MLLRVNLATGQVTGSSVYVHDLGSAGRLYCSGRWRLDNRDELLGRQGLPPNASDAELIVQAYLAFGESHPEQLLGDFAYGLFDARDRQLRLVRDHMGVMPLYFHRAGDLCIASPSLDTLLAQPEIPRELDEGVVAEWCVNGHVYNQVDTFYNAIKKVPRATRMRLGSRTRQAGVYWSPADIEPLVEKRESVLIEQLHDLLETVILDRVGATGGQAAHLSGGLDSTPIAIVAGRACRQQGRDFHTWNWCRPGTGDDSDWHEWSDARRVARYEGFTHREIEITPDTLLEELLNHDLARDGTTAFSYERHVVRQAQTDGVRRIFSGFGGDEFLSSRSRDRHMSTLRAGRYLEVLRRLTLESDLRRPAMLPRLAKRCAHLLQNACSSKPPPERLRPLQEQKHRVGLRLQLLTPEFAAYAVDFMHDRRGRYLSYRIFEQQIDYMNLGYHQERMESWAILGGRHDIRYVYPYLDKRLVEFALALPGEWYFRREEHRYLYKRALGDNLLGSLKAKAKPRETERVRQLMLSHMAVLSHPRVHERVADAFSPHVDTERLLIHLERLGQADSRLWEQNFVEIMAAVDSLLALNLEDG